MWWFAKSMQALSIVTLLYALYVGVWAGDMSRELILFGLGGLTFVLARQLEKRVT